MKSMKAACKVSAAKKLHTMRKAYANGGRAGYAMGGMVDDEEDMNEPLSSASEGMGIEGNKAKSRLDKGKTNINIIIAAGGKEKPQVPPVVPPMPPIPGPPPAPPMPPMGAGGPPPPMRNGGRMAYKNGGKVKHAAGGGLGRLEKIKAYGLKPAKGGK